MEGKPFSEQEISQLMEIVGDRSVAINLDVKGTIVPQPDKACFISGCREIESETTK